MMGRHPRAAIAALAVLAWGITSAHAQTSEAFIASEPGDFIGQGDEYSYSEADTTFTVFGEATPGGQFRIDLDGPENWSLNIGLPQDAEWAPGMYAGAQRTPFRNPRKPGVSFTGEGRGCNTVFGWFEIHDIVLSDTTVTSLAVDFVQHCGDELDPVLYGQVRFNSDVPLNQATLYANAGPDIGTIEGEPITLRGLHSRTQGAGELTFAWEQLSGPTAEIASPTGHTSSITPPEGPADMTFRLTASAASGATDSDTVRVLVRGNNEPQTYLRIDSPLGDFVGQGETWFHTGDDSQITSDVNFDGGSSFDVFGDALWFLDFAAPEGQAFVPGSYESATRFPFQEPDEPGLSWSGEGRGCNKLTGRFDVWSLTMVGNTVQSAAVDFEQSCEGDSPSALGQMRFNVVPDSLPQADAGPNQSPDFGEQVVLDGSASQDDQGIVTYQWTQVSGTEVTLSGADTETASFTAPEDGLAGESLTFKLAVTDGDGNYHVDTVVARLALDSDGDGVLDDDDAFPNDPDEQVDSDGDGVGDNADGFPNDPTRTMDTDGDGVDDEQDAFPKDPREHTDSDGDGAGDNSDDFPNDPSEVRDSDGDGVGDYADAFPNDPTETQDSDGDGIGDNSDTDPDNAGGGADADGDGFDDDIDPDDDNDGIPDADEGRAPGGDGNDDGIPDSTQRHVRSLEDTTGAVVTLESGAGVTLTSVSTSGNPDAAATPPDVNFYRGFVSFDLTTSSEGTVTVTLFLHSADPPDSYWKYNATTAAFEEFLFDGTTGAEIFADRVVLHFVDGGRGDADGEVNGRITDPGAPSWSGAESGAGGATADPGTAGATEDDDDDFIGALNAASALLLFALGALRRRRVPSVC